MNKRTRSGVVLAGFLSVVVLARPARAQDMIPPPPPDPSMALPPPTPPPVETSFATQPTHTGHFIPTSLVINNQYFDATPWGFRSYLETIRWTNPQLYAQLSPDVDRLQSHQTTAITLLVVGAAAGIATAVYGIATRSDCVEPPLSDPNFAADSQAWGDCDKNNIERMATFGFIGAGVLAAGFIGAWITAPSRGDLLDVVNKHNRASTEPMHLQIGYDPTHQLAHAGAVLSF